jgi:hypothetical protein
MLRVFCIDMLGVVMQNDFVLSVVMLGAIMLSVVAPSSDRFCFAGPEL